MNRRILISISTLLFLFLSTSAFGGNSEKDMLSRNILSSKDTGGICTAVKKSIGEGIDSRNVVRTAVELGHNVCIVIKCAIFGGGNLERIILGAIEAGATSDVASRCALDAGAEAGDVSKYLLSAGLSQCYFQPPGYPYTPAGGGEDPIPPPPPPPPPPHFVSPSRF